jgi:hypothetical protein
MLFKEISYLLRKLYEIHEVCEENVELVIVKACGSMPLGFKVLTNWRPSTHFKIDITEFNIK